MKLEGSQTAIRATKMIYDESGKSFISSTSKEGRARLIEHGAIVEANGDNNTILTINISNISKDVRSQLGFYV